MAEQQISINNLPDLLTVREVAQILRVSLLPLSVGAKEESYRQLELTAEATEDIKKKPSFGSSESSLKKNNYAAFLLDFVFGFVPDSFGGIGLSYLRTGSFQFFLLPLLIMVRL